jgi:hypothetical protein
MGETTNISMMTSRSHIEDDIKAFEHKGDDSDIGQMGSTTRWMIRGQNIAIMKPVSPSLMLILDCEMHRS